MARLSGYSDFMATVATSNPAQQVARWRPGTSVGVTVIALLLGQGVALLAMSGFGGRDGVTLGSALGLVLADVVILAVVLSTARRGADRVTGATLGLRRTRFWPAVGWATLAYLTMLGASAISIIAFGPPGGEASSGGAPILDEETLAVVLVFAVIAVTAPIVEEIVFRGYLFPALTRWRGPWPAAVLTGILFGAAHVAVHPPQVLLTLAVLGFALCLVYWFTGSLLPCIALHAAHNAMVVSIQLGWGVETLAAIVGAPIVCLLLVAPFSRAKAPQLAQASA
jgi:uncharacterized protein